jgi:ABC-type nitrate/sulfonate/bicarbonate transport system ATPase subunit
MVASSVAADPGGEIVIRNVVKSFPHNDGSIVPALSGVNLDIAPGEFVSLIGPSGCGKTTLLRLITGLISPDAGDLTVDGEAIRGPDSARGLVFQNPLLFPWLNIHDNVAFGLRARRVYRGKKGEVEALLKLVGLERFGRSYPHQLSGGMAQRASLARALVNHPRVLLMDEPLGALDAFTRMTMQDEIIHIWKERKTTMVMVTHDVDEAIYLSDMVVVMSPGPARIETVLDVPLARPRARSNPDFLLLRTGILKILNFGGQSGEPNYMI